MGKSSHSSLPRVLVWSIWEPWEDKLSRDSLHDNNVIPISKLIVIWCRKDELDKLELTTHTCLKTKAGSIL